MDAERIIDEIEQLQETFEAPDVRPLSASDLSALNRKHDESSRLAGCPTHSRTLCSVLGLDKRARRMGHPNLDISKENKAGPPARSHAGEKLG
jgi:hypothetical protein